MLSSSFWSSVAPTAVFTRLLDFVLGFVDSSGSWFRTRDAGFVSEFKPSMFAASCMAEHTQQGDICSIVR